MKLPFRYQFILTPLIIVIILTGLVAYTLFELTNIIRENGVLKQWERLTDSIQTTILSATRLNKIIQALPSSQNIGQSDQFFNYLEQSQILSGNLKNPTLLKQVSSELRQKMISSEKLMRDPEQINPDLLKISLTELLPILEYQYKLFTAQRRTAFINNHLQLVIISSRLTTVLITALILCITLATGLAIWSVIVIRKRLSLITQRAHAACNGEVLPLPAPPAVHDELDDLETCLIDMTNQLIKEVSVKNVLLGVENERRRIAMDMHDGVLVDLTAVTRNLDSLREASVNPGNIDTLRTDVNEIIKDLRRTIDDLHPQILEILGLGSALNSFLDRHRVVANFPDYHFEYDDQIENRIPIYHKINLFRMITEAINNIIKHAHCDKFEVCLRIVENNLVATIEDNGVGNYENISPNINTVGHGYANITERANLINGTIQWRTSRFTSGICFEISLPMEQS